MQVKYHGDELKIRYSRRELSRQRQHFPEEDFASPTFDTQTGGTSEVLLLLSTPRSGSSFLCDQLRLNGGFVPHEYFGVRHAIPHLADRWGCIDSDGNLDPGEYVKQLKVRRTGRRGILGINVHGFHLPVFDKFMPYFGSTPFRTIWISRTDRLAQAISLTIAQQTNQWTKYHSKVDDPTYDFQGITENLTRLARQDVMIEAFIARHNLDVERVSYEEVARAPEEIVPGLLGRAPTEPVAEETLITKQTTNRNAAWRERYLDDCLKLADRSGDGPALLPRRLMFTRALGARTRRALRRSARAGRRAISSVAPSRS